MKLRKATTFTNNTEYILKQFIQNKRKRERESKQSFAITEDFRTSFTISVRTRVGSLREKKKKKNQQQKKQPDGEAFSLV